MAEITVDCCYTSGDLLEASVTTEGIHILIEDNIWQECKAVILNKQSATELGNFLLKEADKLED